MYTFLDRWNVIFCLTLQDLNIGIALWLAAAGDGWVCEGDDEGYLHVRYRSKARILLVGSGADEQCAGYGRHRTKYKNGRCDVLRTVFLTSFYIVICKVSFLAVSCIFE